MPRTKAFDRDAVLEKAMDLFWRKGYEATSMQDLVQGMGIGRGSMYETFGGKQELFQACIDRYSERMCERWRPLESDEVTVDDVRRFFRGFVDMAASPEGVRGCFVTNSAVELAPHCKDTAARIRKTFSFVEESLFKAFAKLRKRGELKCSHSPRALARHFSGLIQSVAVMAKARTDRKVLKDMVDVALSVLET